MPSLWNPTHRTPPDVTEKVQRFLLEHEPDTPCLIVDLEVVEQKYRALRSALPAATVYYAIKANPAIPILSLLDSLGSSFDAASIHEVDLCLEVGIPPERISYGTTIKKSRDIARAHAAGIRLFAFDSQEELDKLAREAPDAKVYCRFLMEGHGADWPLSEKFGCDPAMASDLLVKAADLGLEPYGVSFHVGSQQRHVNEWDIAIVRSAQVFADLEQAGIELKMVNLGGGLPARYRGELPRLGDYAEAIMRAVGEHFGPQAPELIIEPGRFLPADAGIIQSEVVLISRKRPGDESRWVFLDIGRYGGLVEVLDEAIRYRIETPRDGGPTGPVAIAGPTCDEVDILYERADYELPLDLQIGDKVRIMSAGAYTATCASVGFNGFPPMREYYI